MSYAIRRFCKQGHDTQVVGRYQHGNLCCECSHIKSKRNLKNLIALNWKRRGIKNLDGTLFTHIDFDRAYQVQQGRCANKACNKHQSELSKTFHVDHDHLTGQFRGLLCNNCNCGLGNFKDSIPKIKGILLYLEERLNG